MGGVSPSHAAGGERFFCAHGDSPAFQPERDRRLFSVAGNKKTTRCRNIHSDTLSLAVILAVEGHRHRGFVWAGASWRLKDGRWRTSAALRPLADLGTARKRVRAKPLRASRCLVIAPSSYKEDYITMGEIRRVLNIAKYQEEDGRIPDCVRRRESLRHEFSRLLRHLVSRLPSPRLTPQKASRPIRLIRQQSSAVTSSAKQTMYLLIFSRQLSMISLAVRKDGTRGEKH